MHAPLDVLQMALGARVTVLMRDPTKEMSAILEGFDERYMNLVLSDVTIFHKKPGDVQQEYMPQLLLHTSQSVAIIPGGVKE